MPARDSIYIRYDTITFIITNSIALAFEAIALLRRCNGTSVRQPSTLNVLTHTHTHCKLPFGAVRSSFAFRNVNHTHTTCNVIVSQQQFSSVNLRKDAAAPGTTYNNKNKKKIKIQSFGVRRC